MNDPNFNYLKKLKGVPDGYSKIKVDGKIYVFYYDGKVDRNVRAYIRRRIKLGIFEGLRWFLAGILEEDIK